MRSKLSRREAGRIISGAVEDVTTNALYEKLAFISRTCTLPEDLPPLPKTEKERRQVLKLAKRLLGNTTWWESAPDHFALDFDWENSVIESAKDPKFSGVSNERMQRAIESIQGKGLSKCNLKSLIGEIVNMAEGKKPIR